MSAVALAPLPIAAIWFGSPWLPLLTALAFQLAIHLDLLVEETHQPRRTDDVGIRCIPWSGLDRARNAIATRWLAIIWAASSPSVAVFGCISGGVYTWCARGNVSECWTPSVVR